MIHFNNHLKSREIASFDFVALARDRSHVLLLAGPALSELCDKCLESCTASSIGGGLGRAGS